MYSIFECRGGIGKSIMATAVVSAMKKQYPDREIIVVTAYPEVFLNNPEVYRSILIGSPAMVYFYENYIKGKDVKIFQLEPYQAEKQIKGEQHLIKTWCELYGIAYNGEMPKIFLSNFEIKRAESLKGKKPIMLIQPFGGGNEKIPYSWNRDISPDDAIAIVKKYEKDYKIFQIGRSDQPTVAEKLTAPFRDLFATIAISDKRVFIDSFGQHVAAALNLPSTVCWITNKPNVFGYEMHTNIQARPFDKQLSSAEGYLEEFTIDGSKVHQFPYNDDRLFDIEKI